VRLKQYEFRAIRKSGEPWTVLLNRAALGRALYEPAAQAALEKLNECGVRPEIIEAARAKATEPYEAMLEERANVRLAEYRTNPTPEALEDVVDVFTAMVDDEVPKIPLDLLRAIADLLRSIRTAQTPKAAEAIARRLRVHKSVAFNLDRERAASAYRVLRTANAKDAVAKLVVHELMKESGSDMSPEDVKNAARAVAKRYK
jgi:hypothetical protein